MCSVCVARAARQGGTFCRPCPESSLWKHWGDPERVTLVLFSIVGLVLFLVAAILRPVMPGLDTKLEEFTVWGVEVLRQARGVCMRAGPRRSAQHSSSGGRVLPKDATLGRWRDLS